MFFFTTILVSLIGLCIATYTDLKERIVPNKLNFGLALTGLFIYAVQSILVQNHLPFIYSVWGMLFGFLFAWILWKAGVFAGGDVKLFMALGALNPFTPALLKNSIFLSSEFNAFPVTLFIYSTLAFLPYGLFVIVYKLSKNKPFQKKLWLETKSRLKQAVHFAFFSAAAYTILNYFSITSFAIIILILIWGLFKENKKIITILALIVAFVLTFQNNPLLVVENIVYSLIIIVGFFTLIKLLFSMRPLLSKRINVSKLEEGMIPAVSLIKKGNKIIEAESISIKSIIKYARAKKINELFYPKNEIISSRRACGLTQEELKKIKQLSKSGKIPKTIIVKDTMPFVPTVLLGYIFCIILGDVWLILVGGLI
jgi:archaeal preflagellin peptidase FlaK